MFLPEQSRPPNILCYERSSLHPSRSVIVFIWSSFTKKISEYLVWWPKCTFFDVTPYIIFTNPGFLRLYCHIWHPWNISFPTIYNFTGVKCTYYKLCSVQSKLVYFSQFWDMKHFLGPVCDIWPQTLCAASSTSMKFFILKYSTRWNLVPGNHNIIGLNQRLSLPYNYNLPLGCLAIEM